MDYSSGVTKCQGWVKSSPEQGPARPVTLLTGGRGYDGAGTASASWMGSLARGCYNDVLQIPGSEHLVECGDILFKYLIHLQARRARLFVQ